MKKLWVSTKLAAASMETKASIDALAVNMLIKRMFVDSRVKNATTRRLMSLLHTSCRRCVTAVNEGIRRGWLIRRGNALIAAKIHFKKEFSVLIETTEYNRENPVALTLTQMGNLLREAVIYNHIAKQNDLADTIRLATNPEVGEFKAHKKARRKLSKKDMRVNESNAAAVVRLSYKRISSLVNASRTKVKSMIRSMFSRGLINMTHCFEEAGVSIEDFSKQMREQYCMYARGFMVLMDGLVHIQLANRYSINDDSRIKLFF